MTDQQGAGAATSETDGTQPSAHRSEPAQWRPTPPGMSPKGQRTRAALLRAARTVFERDGLIHARVADITREAGMSHGAFYTYFDSKDDIFRVLITDVMDGIWHTRVSTDGQTGLSAYARIERSNRHFIKVYRENAALFGLHEQGAAYDQTIREHRNLVRRRSVERVRISIERMQAEGMVRDDVEAGLTAHALVSMVSNCCYFWLVMGEGDFDDEEAAQTLTKLWASALHLQEADS